MIQSTDNMRHIQFVVLAVLVILVNVESLNVSELIPDNDRADCTCDISGDNNESYCYCKAVNISILARYTGKTIQISCKETLNSTLALPELGVAFSSHNLILHNCLSTELTLSDFLGCLKVGATTTLSVEGKMDTLASRQLANLTNVIRLELIDLGLTHIDPNVFGDEDSPDSSIKKLIFRHNNISQLDHRVFKKLVHLEILDISYNQLTTLPEDLFVHNKALFDLSIGHNRMESLPSKLFRNQKALRLLYMNHNQLKHFSGDWTGLESLFVLDLSYNQLTSLGEGEESVFRHLHKLDNLWLQNNHLTRLYRDWGRLKSIVSIYLPHNNIETFEVKDFAEVSHDMEINLSDNNITKVIIDPRPIGLVNDTTNAVVTVVLSHNPLICDCHLQSFVRYTRGDQALSLSNVRFEFDNPECGNPPMLKNRRIADLSLVQLACSP